MSLTDIFVIYALLFYFGQCACVPIIVFIDQSNHHPNGCKCACTESRLATKCNPNAEAGKISVLQL